MDNLILLVEDNEDDAILLKYTLESAGIFNPVHVVETAAGAIRYLAGEAEYSDRHRHPFPAAAFIDLKLPGGSGLQVLEWLQRNIRARQVLRVVLTGSDDPEDLKQSYALGANCYLQKPLTIDQLTAPNRSIRMMLSAAEKLAQAV